MSFTYGAESGRCRLKDRRVRAGDAAGGPASHGLRTYYVRSEREEAHGTCECREGFGGERCEIGGCSARAECSVLDWDAAASAAPLPERWSAVTGFGAFADGCVRAAACGTGECKASPSYKCDVASSVKTRADGAKVVDFTGATTPVPFKEAGCHGGGYTCAGPSLSTRISARLPAGVRLSLEYEASARRPNGFYEVLGEAYFCGAGAAFSRDCAVRPGDAYVFHHRRGDHAAQGYGKAVFTTRQPGFYKLVFHVGSYDFTGFGEVGAKVMVRPVLVEKPAPILRP